MRLSRFLGPALLFLTAVGCGDGITRREVSGSVTFDGAPLANGLIEFDPLDGQPTRADAKIVDGKFRLPRAEGLADGKYRVRISATGRTDPVPVPPGHVGPPPVPKEWIPPKIPDRYNRNSDLSAAVSSAESPLSFELKKDGKGETRHDIRRDGKYDPGTDAKK